MSEGRLFDDYERPAIRALAGNVRGLDVLDASRSAGEHTAWLQDEGARVTAFDASRDEALPLEKESFDLVFCSLTLHFLREWEPRLREFHRVARPGGALVFSTHHPCMGLHDAIGADYFSIGMVEERPFGEEAVVRYWRRPLGAMTDAVVATAWRIERIVEPRLGDAVDPLFLFVRATR